MGFCLSSVSYTSLTMKTAPSSSCTFFQHLLTENLLYASCLWYPLVLGVKLSLIPLSKCLDCIIFGSYGQWRLLKQGSTCLCQHWAGGRPGFIQESAVAASAGILDVTVSKDQRPMWYHRPILGLYFSKTAVSMTLCSSVVSFLKRQLYVTLLSIVRMTTRGSQMVCYRIKEFCQSAFSGCVYNNYLKKKNHSAHLCIVNIN